MVAVDGYAILIDRDKRVTSGDKELLSKAPITGPGWLYDDHFEVDGGWSTIKQNVAHDLWVS